MIHLATDGVTVAVAVAVTVTVTVTVATSSIHELSTSHRVVQCRDIRQEESIRPACLRHPRPGVSRNNFVLIDCININTILVLLC